MNRNSLKRLALGTVIVSFFAGAVTVTGAAPATAVAPVATASATRISAPAIVIAHRGASGLRPEHTLAAYELALVQGADFIELDLVATRDGRLISRHENALAMVVLDESGEIAREADGRPRIREATTNVADRPEFADRLAVKRVDGRPVAGWFSEDFTLAEVRSLKARERLPGLRPQNQLHDDRYVVPTLAQVIELVNQFERRTGRQAGLYIEIKHPTYFSFEGRRLDGSAIDMDLGAMLLDRLQASGFTSPDRIFIQAFELAPLIELKDRMDTLGLSLPLIQLFGDVFNLRYRAAPRDLVYHAMQGSVARYGQLDSLLEGGINEKISYAELATPAVLEYMSVRYAAGIGPPRQNILLTRQDDDQRALTFTGEIGQLLHDALAAGLLIHPYTLRAELPFLLRYRERTLTVTEEARLLLEAGVHGFFIDQPSEGRFAVDGELADGDAAREL